MASVIMKITVCDKNVRSRTINGKMYSMNLFSIDSLGLLPISWGEIGVEKLVKSPIVSKWKDLKS